MSEKEGGGMKKHVRYTGIPHEEAPRGPLRPQSSNPLNRQKPSSQPHSSQTKAKSKKGPKGRTSPGAPSVRPPPSQNIGGSKKKKSGMTSAPPKAFVITKTKSSTPSTLAPSPTKPDQKGQQILTEDKKKFSLKVSIGTGTTMMTVSEAMKLRSTVSKKKKKDTTAVPEEALKVAVSKGPLPSVSSKSKEETTVVLLPEDNNNNLKVGASKKISRSVQSTAPTSRLTMGVTRESSFKIRKELWMSPSEAAARLSLPWPLEVKDSAAEETEGADKKGMPTMSSSLVKEMSKYLKNHSEGKKAGGLGGVSGGGRRRSRGRVLEEELDAALGSMKAAYLEEKLMKDGGGRNFKPSVPPKWEEVETNWPGFDRKPVANWEEFYAVPPPVISPSGLLKSVLLSDQPEVSLRKKKGGGTGGQTATTRLLKLFNPPTPLHLQNNKNNNNNKDADAPPSPTTMKKSNNKQERIIEHCGGGCMF